MRNSLRVAAMAAAVLSSASGSFAQKAETYPEMPVHIVVPFPAGGPADILARAVGQRLSENWQQPVVIDNKPGANTAVAAARMAKTTPDGYTLFVVMDVTMVLNPLTTKDLPYDPQKDFAPISLLSKNTSLLSVRAADGPKTVQELIDRGRSKPGALNFGAGIITTRLAAELFNREAGIKAQYVPFQGSPPTVQGLMTGSVDYIVDGAASSLPLIQAGQMRALAKMNDGPILALPTLKTMAAAVGAPSLDDISTWIGIVAPAGTPRAIIDKIQGEVKRMYADEVFFNRLLQAGINPVASTPDAMEKFIVSETKRWAPVVKDIGLEMN